MGILNIREAKREGARLVIGLAGISGSGKTYTALQIAYGLANYDSRKVGLLDTENRRGSLYANSLVDSNGEIQPFLVGDLEPPFSPRRYVDAILEFQRAGVEVLVIDSATHEYEGTGGVEEIAHAQNPRMPDWATAKREHKAFMNTALQCNMHIIFCIRAREKVQIQKSGGRTEVVPLGIMPVCEKNFMFEMTASLLMHSEGSQQDVMKCPADLAGILGRSEGYITAADGKALREWVDGGVKLDPEVEAARATLKTTSEKGLAALEKAFTALPANVKKALVKDGSLLPLKTAAAAFDKQRIDGQPGGAAIADLNAELDDAS
ncbi:putative replicative DNA helicase [Xanthomonas phage FoX5]|uniref:Putative replicative DNA helicase n=1 Tax=Xanthomonas phage FoX5 TaxID=2723901 RepID=A0A858NQR6_9CAUD|nr:putative replicative DNA helicase [Xanthomonas phage FoX5]QJB22016.1 putative replicative DNA helicase [Xanthomonas phage FoX5]